MKNIVNIFYFTISMLSIQLSNAQQPTVFGNMTVFCTEEFSATENSIMVAGVSLAEIKKISDEKKLCSSINFSAEKIIANNNLDGLKNPNSKIVIKIVKNKNKQTSTNPVLISWGNCPYNDHFFYGKSSFFGIFQNTNLYKYKTICISHDNSSNIVVLEAVIKQKFENQETKQFKRYLIKYLKIRPPPIIA